jgi:hypothetical protein
MHFSFRVAVISLILASCFGKRDQEFEIQTSTHERVKITLMTDRNFIQCSLNDSVTSRWPLNFPVYRIEKGDVNDDGQEDIAVGVIKPTRNDSVTRKRLFLFQVRNNSIIPLWLGSSLGRPLEDFSIHTKDSITSIRAIEKEAIDRYLVAEYQWVGFGLSFRKYILRDGTLDEARDILDNN